MNISLFIYAFVGIIILICMIITWNTASHVNNNIVFGVTLNSEGLKSKELKLLTRHYKKLCHICGIFTVISFLPSIIFNRYSFSIIYLIAWSFFVVIFLTSIPFIIVNKKLTKIKKQKYWFIGNTREISVDTAVSRLKNSKTLPIYWLLPSITLPIISFIIVFLNNKNLSFNFIIFFTFNGLINKMYYTIVLYMDKKAKG